MARMGHIIPGFMNNLLSLGKLCDAGCTAGLDKNTLTVSDETVHPFSTAPVNPMAPGYGAST
jgi:hypothetical protein